MTRVIVKKVLLRASAMGGHAKIRGGKGVRMVDRVQFILVVTNAEGRVILPSTFTVPQIKQLADPICGGIAVPITAMCL